MDTGMETPPGMGDQEGLGFAPSPMAHDAAVHKKGLDVPP